MRRLIRVPTAFCLHHIFKSIYTTISCYLKPKLQPRIQVAAYPVHMDLPVFVTISSLSKPYVQDYIVNEYLPVQDTDSCLSCPAHKFKPLYNLNTNEVTQDMRQSPTTAFPFMWSGLFYRNSLDRSISCVRGVWLVLSLLCLK